MSMSTMIGTEGGIVSGVVLRVAVGIIPVRTCRALEDAVGAVEVALQRAAELLVVVALALAVGKMGGVVLVLVGSTDGRRMVGGAVAVGGVQGRGHPYDEMHQHIGDNTIYFSLFFFFYYSDTFYLLSRFFFASLKLLTVMAFFFYVSYSVLPLTTASATVRELETKKGG